MSEPTKRSGVPETTKTLMLRMHRAAKTLSRHGEYWAGYFAKTDFDDVATQRDTKTHLNKRLKASTFVPQVVTVQARGGKEGGTYVIVPMETMVKTLEASAKEEAFVPITAAMREIGGDIDLPVLTPRGTGRRRRSASAALPQFMSET